ncbi:hypothetical protein THAOC_29381, partial [Thalassiosira oceanica]
LLARALGVCPCSARRRAPARRVSLSTLSTCRVAMVEVGTTEHRGARRGEQNFDSLDSVGGPTRPRLPKPRGTKSKKPAAARPTSTLTLADTRSRRKLSHTEARSLSSHQTDFGGLLEMKTTHRQRCLKRLMNKPASPMLKVGAGAPAKTQRDKARKTGPSDDGQYWPEVHHGGSGGVYSRTESTADSDSAIRQGRRTRDD